MWVSLNMNKRNPKGQLFSLHIQIEIKLAFCSAPVGRLQIRWLKTRRWSRVERCIWPKNVASVRRSDDWWWSNCLIRCRGCGQDGLDRRLQWLEAWSNWIAICTWHGDIHWWRCASVAAELVRVHQQVWMVFWYHWVRSVAALCLGVTRRHQTVKVELVSVSLAVNLRHDWLIVVISGEIWVKYILRR